MNPASPREIDPLAIDRWLDGECSPEEAQALEAAVRAEAQLATRVAERRRFLGPLQEAGVAYRGNLASQMPAHVEARVRLALHAKPRAWAPRRWAPLAAAATVLLAMSAFLWSQKPTPVEAVPEGALRAVDYATWSAKSVPGTCSTDHIQRARASDLVRMGNYEVADCNDDEQRPAARLARVQDLPVVGWAAVHTTDEVRGPDIGMTVLKSHVVFDVARGRQREFLAVSRTHFDELNLLEPDRASCIVCHNRSREGLDNPHDIALRHWK